MNSIRRTLLLWLSFGITIGISVVAVLVFIQAREQADTLFDYEMKQMVASLPDRAFAPLDSPRNFESEEQEDIVIQIWDNKGLQIYRSHEESSLPQRAELGFANVVTHGSTWRVYSAQLGNIIIQVAQPMSARSAVAAQMALRTAAPLLMLLPALALLIWFTVGRSLGAVRVVANEVGARDADSLESISEADVPQEIQPLTAALNGLLSRLRKAIGVQRTFVADAAHELKTPLTALKLQLQLAERAQTDEERANAFSDLKRGLERTTHLVQQLLALARQEPGAIERRMTDLDLAALARDTIAEFANLANSKQIDLGFSGGDTLRVMCDEAGLRTQGCRT
jgi:two-component system OmpR family sensor kinase